MTWTITRRDFLNGTALAIGAVLVPNATLQAAPAGTYPPVATGMRGSQPGSFETAHRMGLGGEVFDLAGQDVDADYDLVVVGAGISGLSAAWFFRDAFGASSSILILDNHDDFGGHARRNEFALPDGSMLIGYGGSESLESPKANLSDEANYLFKSLDIDLDRFTTAFDQKLYASLGLKDGVFFDQATFGTDRLVAGMPSFSNKAEDPAAAAEAPDWQRFLEATPLADDAKAQLLGLFTNPQDYLRGQSTSEVAEYLQSTSYRDYLAKNAKLGDEALKFLQHQTHDYFALGIESVPAYDAMLSGFPGFDGLTFDGEAPDDTEEPYIYHFPDGNASIARMLVRSLIPSVAEGQTMDDIVTARFDYARLDQITAHVRLRLNSTVVRVKPDGELIKLAYVRDGKTEIVKARHAILACYNMVVPHIIPELPDAQRKELRDNVKAPLVYVNVVIANWQSFVKSGVQNIHCPGAFYSTVKLDYPVSLGTYHAPDDPAKPIVLHLVHVPVDPSDGATDIEQFRAGRRALLDMPFETFEAAVKTQLTAMFGPAGFDAAKDILAITVNRWPHGYAYYANSLFLPKNAPQDPPEEMIRPFGKITIANSDSGWNAFAHEAIDQAFRAVGELVEME